MIRYLAKHVVCIFLFKLTTTTCGLDYYYLHFTHEDTES